MSFSDELFLVLVGAIIGSFISLSVESLKNAILRNEHKCAPTLELVVFQPQLSIIISIWIGFHVGHKAQLCWQGT